jgi:ADP-ribosylglycohydrolase
LSVGDAFGERFFGTESVVLSRIAARSLPASPWFWTDDTAMALSVCQVLEQYGRVDSDALAMRFASAYRRDPRRGYGGTAQEILMAISLGAPWREVAAEVFDGQGSMGNGAAMRAAPIGAYFADDLEAAAEQAGASAAPTHAHAEGVAGAVAVAVAAALACRVRMGRAQSSPAAFLSEVTARTPPGATQDGLARACGLALESEPFQAAALLGSGRNVTSADTVPFSLWCAARHLNDFEQALWSTVSGLGDRDTTCAIVGGVVALAVGEAGIPRGFVEAREPLDSKLDYLDRHAIATSLGRH